MNEFCIMEPTVMVSEVNEGYVLGYRMRISMPNSMFLYGGKLTYKLAIEASAFTSVANVSTPFTV